MEQSELRAAVEAAKALEPEPEMIALPDLQTQGNLQERVNALKAGPDAGNLTPGKKVAVLGFTDSWRNAPFDDPTWEIWGLNELYLMIPRWTRWFELHLRSVYEADKKRTSDHILALRSMTVPVYMHQRWPDIPMSVPYPLQAIADLFPNPAAGGRPYLTNSISYMLALAIAEGFEEIMVCGVDMAHDCLAPDMRVLTADLRWVRAGDLQVGQELLAFDEEPPVMRSEGKPAEFRKYRKTTVESLSEAKRPCYRLHMADGTKLTASEGHQWLTLGGLANVRRWLRTDQLQDAATYPNHAGKIIKVTPTWDEDRSWDAGYLAAAFDGEGHVSQNLHRNCTTHNLAVGFSQRLNGMSAQVQKSMAALGFEFRAPTGGADCDKYTVKGSRAEVLRLLGSVRPRRLMDNFDADKVGCLNSIDDVQVLHREAIGEQTTIGITTGTKTLIVEGYASHNSEYSQQRPSCEYFIGIAQGRGIKVTLPPECELLKTDFLYGYEQEQLERWNARMLARERDIETKLSQLDNQIVQANEARAQYRGALQDTQHIRKNWKGLFTS